MSPNEVPGIPFLLLLRAHRSVGVALQEFGLCCPLLSIHNDLFVALSEMSNILPHKSYNYSFLSVVRNPLSPLRQRAYIIVRRTTHTVLPFA